MALQCTPRAARIYVTARDSRVSPATVGPLLQQRRLRSQRLGVLCHANLERLTSAETRSSSEADRQKSAQGEKRRPYRAYMHTHLHRVPKSCSASFYCVACAVSNIVTWSNSAHTQTLTQDTRIYRPEHAPHWMPMARVCQKHSAGTRARKKWWRVDRRGRRRTR